MAKDRLWKIGSHWTEVVVVDNSLATSMPRSNLCNGFDWWQFHWLNPDRQFLAHSIYGLVLKLAIISNKFWGLPTDARRTLWRRTTSYEYLGFKRTSWEPLFDTVHSPITSFSIKTHARGNWRSKVIFHPSTVRAQCCLSSVFEWE